MKTESEEYTEQKVPCFNGKILKWVGKEVATGRWPEHEPWWAIDVYQTRRGTWIAAILNPDESQDVLKADSEKALIQALLSHEWANEDGFMAAVQATFSDEEIWVEEIE